MNMRTDSSFTRRHTSTFTSTPALLHEDLLAPLVRRTLTGDPQAWKRFWLAVDPTIEIIADRCRTISMLPTRADDRRNIVVDVMEHFRDDGFSRLRAFEKVVGRGDGSFRGWLSVTTRRKALDYVRGHAESLGRRAASEAQRRWIAILPLPEDFEEDMPVSSRSAALTDAREVQTYVEANLPAAQQKALALWLVGHSQAEIAAALDLETAEDADFLVRTTFDHLRRRYGGSRWGETAHIPRSGRPSK